MNTNGLFFLDILSIMPRNDTMFYIQASDVFQDGFLSIVSETDDPALLQVKYNEATQEVLKEMISNNDINDYFEYIAMVNDGRTLFEGYDGVDFGLFSKDFNIPIWFSDKYKRGDKYEISVDW